MATIIICDVCGTKEKVSRRRYHDDWEHGGPEGHEETFQYYDLCPECELIAFQMFVKALIEETKFSKSVQEEISKNIKALIKERRMQNGSETDK